MKTYKDYSDYFENLAVQHTDIPHVIGGKKAFTRVDIEEAITGFRTKIAEKSIMMILTNYVYRIVEGGANDQMKAIDMSFFIVGYHKPADFDEAFAMIKSLSNKKHHVYTGVCLRTENKTYTFCGDTEVYFGKELKGDDLIYEYEKHN